MKIAIVIITTLAFGITGTMAVIKSVHFTQNCGGYLERAANANTIEMAEQELSRAILYMEQNELTTGYTSIFWKTPDEDISFWYNNVKTSYNELVGLDSAASALEKSNMLIKLRETLIDHGSKGDHITIPDGISRYPNNGAWAAWLWILFVVMIVSWGAIVIDYD